MAVVNCKVQFIRPKYDNLKEWMKDDDNVYIGRAGVVFVEKERFPKRASPFANPYKVGTHGTREEVIAKFRKYMVEKLEVDPSLKDELLAMKGKTLGCWCKPDGCHGDVLLELIEELSD